MQRGRRIGDALCDNDGLVHRAVYIDLSESEVARVEIQEADDFATRVCRSQAATRCVHKQLMAAEIEKVIGGHRRGHRGWIDCPRPSRCSARNSKSSVRGCRG